jgi:ribosomal protein S18 acetylase RimI-like enzyme
LSAVESWGTFDVGAARPGDIGALLALREEAVRWLRERGIDQWAPGQFPASWLDAGSRDSGVYVLRHGTDVAGTVTISWHDPVVWDDDLVVAGYVANLMVARAFAGQGLGRRLLQWAEDRIGASGRGLVRLSCPAENLLLRALFESAGYYPVTVRGIPDREAAHTVALYEKILSPVNPEERREAEPLAE